MNELRTYDIMLDLLILLYVQFMIMLIELQKLLNLELSICVARLPQFYQYELYQRLWI